MPREPRRPPDLTRLPDPGAEEASHEESRPRLDPEYDPKAIPGEPHQRDHDERRQKRADGIQRLPAADAGAPEMRRRERGHERIEKA